MSKNKDFHCSVTKHDSPLVETEIMVATVSGPDGGVWLHAAERGWVLAVMIDGLMFRAACEAAPKAREGVVFAAMTRMLAGVVAAHGRVMPVIGIGKRIKEGEE
jgi:hypothetical protein